MGKPLGPLALSEEENEPVEIESLALTLPGQAKIVLPAEEVWGLVRPFNGRGRTVLLTLLKGSTQGMAAAAAGVDKDTVARWRKANPDFDKACKLAQDWGFASVYESELHDRALDRSDRASGRLLELVVKSKSADYREKQQVHMDVIHRAAMAQGQLVAGWDSDDATQSPTPSESDIPT